MSGACTLTDFQRLMRSWKELAPYNAAHVLQVSESTDREGGTSLTGLTSQADRWRKALNQTVSDIAPGELIAVETSSLDLDRALECELNRAFQPTEFPLRAVVVPAANDHHLALVYDHWFADSPSIRAFLHRAFERYRGGSCNLPRLRWASRPRIGSAFAAIANGVGTYRRHRRAARVHLRDSHDFRTAFLSRHFPPATINGIRAAARRQGAKVNDVFIAAAAQVLGQHTAAQRAASRRNQLAIASAIDLREAEPDATFGFDVSYFSVVLGDPEESPFASLIRVVAEQTSTMKTDDEIRRFNLSLKCARFAWNLTSKAKRRAELFRKGLPLVAGISNVNLSGGWVEQANQTTHTTGVLDYLRVSPVGPLLPLVFTLTTIGDRLSLCVSFRTTAFANSVAAELVERFMSKLVAFSETAV